MSNIKKMILVSISFLVLFFCFAITAYSYVSELGFGRAVSVNGEWWLEDSPEIIKEKNITYLIDVNYGDINTHLSAKYMEFLNDFQYICGDYNPLGGDTSKGLKIKPYAVNDEVDFKLTVREDKLIVKVNTGEIKVYDDSVDDTLTAGETREYIL